jgi:glycosyltransferase involved in cell wall biosynthesis
VHDGQRALLSSLDSVRRHAPASVEILLLADAPDADARAALWGTREIRQILSERPIGAAACFNRLAGATDADLIVLLESGAVVAPHWLDWILTALDADPRNALAGPSTNRGWNAQCAFAGAGGSEPEVARTAAEAVRRYQRQWYTLAPLYSLSDFCYAVERRVIEEIGAADERYGTGPCWEMDYNIRAARAGFQGVWACAAYVHRQPMTERQRREESTGFDAAKRRYQDKFCALRLRGERSWYEPHCRGEACEHFAPRDLISARLELATQPRLPLAPSMPADPPLVSCIVPTRGRTDWLLQSVRYFQRQHYPARELIVVDDGNEDAAAVLPSDPAIRYVRVSRGTSIGAKRNHACELAGGDIIVQWDDDDWYGADRLSAQVTPLVADRADITGLTSDVFFVLPTWQFWTCTAELHRRLFFGDVHGGTLAYRRRVWELLARYPDVSLAEDAAFLRQALNRGARLERVDGRGHFVYVRHETNAWSFECGRHVDPGGWRRAEEPASLTADREFYAGRIAQRHSPPAVTVTAEHLLVSCIMPTRDRRRFVPQAIDQFLRQDYPNRELIVLDDGTDGVADLLPSDPRIQYHRFDTPAALGAKRNLACQLARGPLIAHWDDDDWMADWRLGYQIDELQKAGADVCGLDTLYFFDPCARRAWQYVYARRAPRWLAGGTLCYTKAYWSAHPFPEVSVGEDAHFIWSSRAERIIGLADSSFYAALVHPHNTSPKQTNDPLYRQVPFDTIVRLLGDALARVPGARLGDGGLAPLVSCIMPTRDRRLFVGQALRYFLRQDYPAKELVIVDDGDDPVQDAVPTDSRMRYIRLEKHHSIGQKRNIAVREACGTLIAHWDDDDWYNPAYLSTAVTRWLACERADTVCGMGSYLVWIAGDPQVRLSKSGGIVGATFLYAKSLWERCPYRDVKTAEDFFFLKDAQPELARIDDPDLFVVVRHGSHTWITDQGRDVTLELRRLPRYRKPLHEVAGEEDARFYASAQQVLGQAWAR